MLQFDIITIFPEMFSCFTSESIIKRAQNKGLIKINVHYLRDFVTDTHSVIDDRPFGGNIGMVMKVEPIYRAVKAIKTKRKSKVILFTPRAKNFNQKKAYEFSKLDQLIMICGRYEGIDERVAKYIADEKVSIGNYVLMGGELAAMVVTEASARLVPNVIGIDKPQILEQRVTKEKKFIEYPQYTRPAVFEPESGKKWRVPKVLLSGHHEEIRKWRKKHSKKI